MKKMCVFLCVIGLLSLSVSPLFAGGIINKQNLSADYFRTLARNASTDAADIVVYNPAGVMKMQNGLYTKLDVQYISKTYSNDVPGYDKYESDTPSVVPGFFALYKQDKWAGFFAITVPGGGGKVEYEDGNARTVVLANQIIAVSGGLLTGINSMYLEADSFDIGYTLGGSYEINEMFSVSGGLRYVDAKQKFKGNVEFSTIIGTTSLTEVDLERTATGVGYFLGVNVAPMDKLNLALTYFSGTELDYESDVSEGNSIAQGIGWGDGTKEREDLPGLLGFGASYQFTPKLKVDLNYTLYLESSANFEAERFDNAGNSWDLAIAFEYAFNPKWKASLGYMRTDVNGMDEEDLLVEAAELDANTFATGAVFTPTDRWRFTLGLVRVLYDSVTTDTLSSRAPADTELAKDVWAFTLGAQYRFF